MDRTTIVRAAAVSGAVVAMTAAMSAHAQRATDNAVTAAQDAFGISVGNETIGLYNPFEVRGFSAIDAGNARIDGLYFDQQIDLVNHLIASSTIRVGISAQGYPLPAPTGVVDYALRRPGDKPIYSFLGEVGPFRALDAEIDFQLPLVPERLGIVGGATINRTAEGIGATAGYANIALSPRWTPSKAVEVIAFASGSWAWNQEAAPAIFVAGPYLPPKVKRDRFYGQHWADNRNVGVNAGLLTTVALGRTTIRIGLFRSAFYSNASYFDLFVDTLPNGEADRVIIAGGGQRFVSNSGELRVSHNVGTTERPHIFYGVLRARHQQRRFGGDDAIDLGRAQIGVPNFLPGPDVIFGPRTRDTVRQYTGAVAYEGRPFSWLELSGGGQKVFYRKSTRVPDDPSLIVGRDNPLLYNAAAAIHLGKRLAFYGSYTRGLEEGGVAPSNAVNKDAASPALRTQQFDAGIRYAITDDLRLVAGAFDVRKPYFNLDPANVYRRLGDYRQRGIEMSLTGSPAKGLYVVAGTLLLDPRVTGEEVNAGTIGPRPVGQTRRLTIASADYTLPWTEGISINAAVTSVARRIASADNRLDIPARSVLDVGARYRFKLNNASATLRLAVGNVFDKFGWRTNSSAVFVPNAQRRASVSLAADF